MTEDEKNNVDQDYNTARETYYDLIEKGREGLECMIEIARESEHPRAFEVLATMIKTISDTNGELMKHNKMLRDMDKKEEKPEGVTNNNLFVGTSAELQKLIQNTGNKPELLIDNTKDYKDD